MVAKINSGASIFGALSYNLDKVEAQNASVLYTNNMIEDTTSGVTISMRNAMLSFETYLLANRKTLKPVVHISINPALADKLTDEQYISLASDYMEQMGYKDQPYIVFKHNDIQREHIHIVTVKVNEYGKKISDSFQKMKSMKACRELEIKYGLKQITDEKKEQNNQFIRPIDYRQGNIKRQMSNTIRSIIENYQFQSLGEYNAILTCFNIQSKYVKGEHKDNLYHGIVYSTTDQKGNLVGNQIKSSRIGKFCGYQALSKAMLKTTNDLKQNPVQYKSKNNIAKAKSESTTKDQFIEKLKENNIDVLLRINEEGKLYGVTFIDHTNKIAFNGSRISKEYSANAMNDWFGTLKSSEKSNSNNEKNIFISLLSIVLQENSKQTEYSDNYYSDVTNDKGLTTFHVTAGAPDPEEEEFIRRMRKKKKKGPKRYI